MTWARSVIKRSSSEVLPKPGYSTESVKDCWVNGSSSMIGSRFLRYFWDGGPEAEVCGLSRGAFDVPVTRRNQCALGVRTKLDQKVCRCWQSVDVPAGGETGGNHRLDENDTAKDGLAGVFSAQLLRARRVERLFISWSNEDILNITRIKGERSRCRCAV